MRSERPGFVGKAIGAAVGAVLLVLGLMFSAVFVVIALLAGVAAWTYFWWKTRALRRELRKRPPGGRVIDGEAVVVDEGGVREQEVLPRNPPS